MSAQNISPAEQVSDPSLFVRPDFVVPAAQDNENTEVRVDNEEASRLQRFGKFMVDFPGNTNDGIQRAAIAFQTDPRHASWRTLQCAVVAGEVSPLNEALRYGALALAFSITEGVMPALVGGLVLGGTTFLIEAPAGVIAADLVTTDAGDRVLTKVNDFIEKKIPNDTKMNPGIEVGVAMLGGSAIVIAEKQREDQSRAKQENVKHALFTASWMSAYFTAEGAFIGAVGEGTLLSAKTIGAFVLATGMTGAAVDRMTRNIRREKQVEIYSNWRNKDDQAIRIGIFGEDLEKAVSSRETVFVSTKNENGVKTRSPLLVPAKGLEWYNSELIEEKYGKDAKVLCYVHPPFADEKSAKKAEAILRKKLAKGYVIITDKYVEDDSSPMARIVEEAKSGEFTMEAFGGDTESRVDVFAGPVAVVGSDGEIFEAPSLYEVYRQAIESGDIQEAQENGVSLQEVVDGDEAEALWEIYKKPFEDLGRDDPTHAGFDKEGLLDILKDPEVTKIINRVDGEITTLCFFLHNFDKAPWFNPGYYKNNYKEYYETGNILMFPGIVSDENKRGNNYAMDVIDVATKLLGKRGSNFLVTFECTEISTTYIPEIVTAAVNNSGVANITGLEKAVNQIEYIAISS